MRRPSRLSLLLFMCLLAGAARADESIGTATKVQPSASGTGAGHAGTLNTGDALGADEVIETKPSGLAHLRFVDNTDLSVGPGSSIKLDKFVFNTQQTASDFALSTTKGVFRFTTGVSDHKAYSIKIPDVAVIGVRGTRFTFEVHSGHLGLDVEQGIVVVCRPDGTQCVEVRPRQHVSASVNVPPHIDRGSTPPRRREGRLPPPPPGPDGGDDGGPVYGNGYGPPVRGGYGPPLGGIPGGRWFGPGGRWFGGRGHGYDGGGRRGGEGGRGMGGWGRGDRGGPGRRMPYPDYPNGR
ncbi:FecR family protein [Methylovirgula sp. 4M-Z18]|uniref:FecR family protein n=1 Tax=Methylovirgula sp. 4M-Z18 TaxID=2293567 RepID=UPI001314D353|nr:FecR domain-containing protein [Methylovirgula sp. 4M-Z18]